MDNEENIIILTDDEDHDTPFQLLDDITLDGVRYAVLASLDEDDEDVLILRVEQGEDGDAYLPEEDEAVLQRVLDTYIVDAEGDSYGEEDFVPAQ